MEDIELIIFQIISTVGTAKSLYHEAVQEAKSGNFERAQDLIVEGEKYFVEGHHVHKELITKEANEEPVKLSLLLMHAEDQLMSAESFKIVAEEFITVHKKFEELEK